MQPRSHLVIPDVQVRPGVDWNHTGWVGNYCAEKRPDVIVCCGDWFDLPSLSSYDIGQASAEGKRYVDDITAGKAAMDLLMRPIKDAVRSSRGKWSPQLVFVLGNHEYRIVREGNSNPRFKGTLTLSDLDLERHGWDVVPFLKVKTVDRVEYVHYVVSGVMGRPVSSAAAMLKQRQCSVVQGHVQKIDIAIHPATQYVALMAGICYTHDETYLGPQGNDTKRGIWRLNEVRNGTFDPMFISINFLARKYS